MLRIDIDEAKSAELIANVTSHLPFGTSLGRVRVANPKMIMTDDGAIFKYDRDGDYTWRIVNLPGGLSELTKWRKGVEFGRQILPTDTD